MENSELFIIFLFIGCGVFKNVLSYQTQTRFYPPRQLQGEGTCVLDFGETKTCKPPLQEQRKPGLVRLDGLKIGFHRRVQLIPGEKHEVITRALRPPLFEIPNFLTKEECEHLIKKAEKAGLMLSEVGLPVDKQIEENNTCFDNDRRCRGWAELGECKKNPKYMLKKCRESCKLCKDERAYRFENFDLDKDGVLTGHELIKALQMLYVLFMNEEEIQEMFQELNITQFGPGEKCEDNEDSCSQLAGKGACDVYPMWMLLTCRKSCRNCGCEDLENNCSLLADEEKCLDYNYVHWMLRNCRRSCQVCLGAINNETYHSLNPNAIFRYIKTLERSHPRHRPRYSHTAWLQSTYVDPVESEMLDRNQIASYNKSGNLIGLHTHVLWVGKLTELPFEIVNGAESLQIVKYDKYGHYHAHYDTSPSKDPTLICCHQSKNQSVPCRLCRLVTILFYLNDVDEGGETAFVVADNSTLNETLLQSKRGKEGDPYNLSKYCNEANLIVAPKRGTAVMWYNHLLDSDNQWIGERDSYSLHGGCDVKRGTKWIANLWIPAPHKNNKHLPSIYGRRKL